MVRKGSYLLALKKTELIIKMGIALRTLKSSDFEEFRRRFPKEHNRPEEASSQGLELEQAIGHIR